MAISLNACKKDKRVCEAYGANTHLVVKQSGHSVILVVAYDQDVMRLVRLGPPKLQRTRSVLSSLRTGFECVHLLFHRTVS